MQYNVAQLLKESTGSTRIYNMIEEFTSSGRVADRVEGQLKLLKTHQGILVQVKLGAWVTDECSRCDNEFPRTSEFLIEEEFFPAAIVNDVGGIDALDDPDAFVIDEHNLLDISEVVRQSVIADQPMKPLCTIECRGLCQVCGVDLNVDDCSCNDSQVDPRWAALAELLPRNNGRGKRPTERN